MCDDALLYMRTNYPNTLKYGGFKGIGDLVHQLNASIRKYAKAATLTENLTERQLQTLRAVYKVSLNGTTFVGGNPNDVNNPPKWKLDDPNLKKLARDRLASSSKPSENDSCSNEEHAVARLMRSLGLDDL
jgi:hypothetical protein